MLPEDNSQQFNSLKPERFDVDPNSSTAAKQWLQWQRTFMYFLTAIATHNPNKLNILIDYVTPIYNYITECETYDAVIQILQALYVKLKNEVFARHLLATCRHVGRRDTRPIPANSQAVKQEL